MPKQKLTSEHVEELESTIRGALQDVMGEMKAAQGAYEVTAEATPGPMPKPEPTPMPIPMPTAVTDDTNAKALVTAGAARVQGNHLQRACEGLECLSGQFSELIREIGAEGVPEERPSSAGLESEPVPKHDPSLRLHSPVSSKLVLNRMIDCPDCIQVLRDEVRSQIATVFPGKELRTIVDDAPEVKEAMDHGASVQAESIDENQGQGKSTGTTQEQGQGQTQAESTPLGRPADGATVSDSTVEFEFNGVTYVAHPATGTSELAEPNSEPAEHASGTATGTDTAAPADSTDDPEASPSDEPARSFRGI